AQDRADFYEQVRPHLKFAPEPLDVYVARAGQRAEREQLPIRDEAGQMHSFQVPKIGVDRVAEEAMAKSIAARTLTLVCQKCFYAKNFYALESETPTATIRRAREEGWVYDYKSEPVREICPRCANG